MLFLFLKLALLFAPGYQLQVGGNNCLRTNPGVLDAVFSLHNKFETRWDWNEKDVAKHIALFTTRFKSGHLVVGYGIEELIRILKGVSLYNQMHNSNFKVFIQTPFHEEFDNITRGIQLYQEIFEMVTNVNSGNQSPISGLYVDGVLTTCEMELRAMEIVFGPKENSTVPIGFTSHDCLTNLTNSAGIQYLQRLEFVTCKLLVMRKSSAEESAVEVTQTCKKMRDAAISLNITAKFMCTMKYPSFGTTTTGIVGSVSDFQRFWCKINELVTQNKDLPQIIMESSFDEPPDNYQDNWKNLSNSDYHLGWWRRREVTSYDANAFIEKVEELEESKLGNCAGICSPCKSDSECCNETYCEPDNSFQPFETGPSHNVCKTILQTCAPRPSSIFAPPTSSSTSDSGVSNFSVGIISVSVVGVLIFVVSIIAFFVYRRSRFNAILTQLEINQFFVGGSSPCRPKPGQDDNAGMVGNLPYDKQLEISKHDFKIREEEYLGSGAFGVVVKGILRNNDVAVKTTLPGVDKIYFKSLLLELKVLMYLGQHENVVNLLGAYTSQINSGKLYLFLELCPLGNLLDVLRSHRDNFSYTQICGFEFAHIQRHYYLEFYRECSETESKQVEKEGFQLTSKRLLQWSVQIASAMEHLALKRVIHADIAARNILVFSEDLVKLTDFGLSRRLYEYSNYVKKSQEPLPWRHMSVEALRDMNFSVNSDVWSFGVTLWEMFSLGCVPYPGHSLSEDFVELILGGLSLSSPKHAHPRVYEVMKSCWKIEVKLRPPISLVHSNLVSVLNEIYTNHLYFSPLNI